MPNGSGANTSACPGPQQRPRRRPGLGDVRAADPQLEPPGVLVADRLGPHRAERAAQPGGELLAAVDHLRGGHAVGQVDLGPPAGAVLADRRREADRDAPSVSARLISAMPSEPSARVMTSWSGGCTCAGSSALRRDRLALRPPGQRERHEQRDGGERPPPPRREHHHGDDGGGQAGQAQRQDRAARLAGLLRLPCGSAGDRSAARSRRPRARARPCPGCATRRSGAWRVTMTRPRPRTRAPWRSTPASAAPWYAARCAVPGGGAA